MKILVGFEESQINFGIITDKLKKLVK